MHTQHVDHICLVPRTKKSVKHSRNEDNKERKSTVRHGQGRKTSFRKMSKKIKDEVNKDTRRELMDKPRRAENISKMTTHTIPQTSMNDIHCTQIT
jgi:hypothetical protein